MADASKIIMYGGDEPETPLLGTAIIYVKTDGIFYSKNDQGAITQLNFAATPIINSIINGDTTHAPDGNSVFDALALKANLISPSFTTPVLGTPASGTLTNCTGLPQAGVIGLTTTDSPVFGTVKLSGLTDGFIPKHTSDAEGLVNSSIFSDSLNAKVVGSLGIGVYPSAQLDIQHPTAGTIANQLILRKNRSWTATTDGLVIVGTGGTLGTHDYGAICMRSDPNNGSGGRAFVDFHAGGYSSGRGDASKFLSVYANDSNVSTLCFMTNSLNRIVIGNSGAVGVGTDSAASKLSVAGNLSVGASYAAVAAPTNGAIFEGNVGIGTSTPNNLFQVLSLINFNNALESTCVGYQAGYSNTTINNTFFGYQAGYYSDGSFAADTGYGNSAFGRMALFYNTTGKLNCAFGELTLSGNTTGRSNTAFGRAALLLNTTGSYNTSVGYGSLINNLTGSYNTSVGYDALNNIDTNYNTAIGYRAGTKISDNTTLNTTSFSSIYIGSSTKPLSNGDENEIVIGNQAIGAGSNTTTIGNTSITKTVLKGNVSGGNLSVGSTYAAIAAPVNGAIFEGNVGIGTSSATTAKLISVSGSASIPGIIAGNSGTLPTLSAGTAAVFIGNLGNTSYATSVTILGGSLTGSCSINFGDENTEVSGAVYYIHNSDVMEFYTAATKRLAVNSSGLDIIADTIRLRTSKTPASSTAAGNAGDICWDSTYFYICVATNTWHRVAHTTW